VKIDAFQNVGMGFQTAGRCEIKQMKVTKCLLLIAVISAGLILSGCAREQETVETEPGTAMPNNAQATVNVGLAEWYVTLSPSTIEAGEIVFDVVNEGEVQHAVTIEGEGVEERSENLSPGETTSMTVNLTPGTYDVYCPIGDHRERGMEAVLTVE
jgi:uncharacterized cupredoxin-like copper-binding protein